MPTIYSMTQANYGMYRFAQKSGYSLFGGAGAAGSQGAGSLFGARSSRATNGLSSLLNAQSGTNAYALMNLKANTRSVLKSYHEASDGFYKTFDAAMSALSKSTASLKNTNFNVTGATEADTKANTDAALKNVKDFVSNYNDTIKMFGDYSDVSSRAAGMEKLFGDASYKADTLRQVGITVNSPAGTLSVNDAALTKALKEEPNRVENILGKDGLAGATEKKVDFAKTQRDKIFPSAQQMLGSNYQRALAYTSAGSLTSMNAYANVGTLLSMFF